MALDWEKFIKESEASAPDPADLKAVADFFKDKLGCANPGSLEGYSEANLQAGGVDDLTPQRRALAIRVFRSADAVYSAKRYKKTLGAATTGLPSPGAAGVASGLSLASALAPPGGSPTADTTALLAVAGCSKLPYHLQAEQSLWDTLQNHTTTAVSQGKTPFAFVDLTDKAVLPVWLPVEAIGGRFTFQEGGEATLSTDSSVASLGELSKALKTATSTSRFFRTTAQWVASWDRYSVVAVGTNQMTWSAVHAHRDQVMKLVEAERIQGKSPYLAFVYDVLHRTNIARRANRKDPELDLEKEFSTLDKECLEVARARLDSVLLEAGLKGKAPVQGTGTPAPSAAPSAGQADSSAASTAAQALAKAEQLQKAQQQAAANLKAAQDQLLQKGAAMKGGHPPSPGGGGRKGGQGGKKGRDDGYANSKAAKYAKWQQRQQHRKKDGW